MNKQTEWRCPDEIIRPVREGPAGKRQENHTKTRGNEYLSKGISRHGTNVV